MNPPIYPLQFDSRLHFKKKWPSTKKLAELVGCQEDHLLVVYDRKLKSKPFFKDFLSTSNLNYEVRAGESLKDLDHFSGHTKSLLSLMNKKKISRPYVLAIGGGSVGDFAGFFASTFKRGVPLAHVPTTWLSAIDSSHGGKTALNVKGFKNQIGSFYPAADILIVREFFEALPQEELDSAMGEMVKMVFIKGTSLLEIFEKTNRLDLPFFWKCLPDLIEAKREIVRRDPFEQFGLRRQLNLGHSFAHVIELEYGLAHGKAVALGLEFAMQWSLHRGYLSSEIYQKCEDLLFEKSGCQRLSDFFRRRKKLKRSKIIKLFRQDKKSVRPFHLDFVFLKDLGEPLIKTVDLESLAFEAHRQGVAE